MQGKVTQQRAIGQYAMGVGHGGRRRQRAVCAVNDGVWGRASWPKTLVYISGIQMPIGSRQSAIDRLLEIGQQCLYRVKDYRAFTHEVRTALQPYVLPFNPCSNVLP